VLSPAEGSGRLSWFEAPGDPYDPNWIEHVLDPALDHAHGLAVADIDCDGQIDIVVAKMHQATMPQEVAVYRSLGRGESWTKQVVATSGSHNIALADIGNTGRLSIFGANWNDHSPTGGAVELWVNEG
jgi:hypothetical protein